LFRIHIHAALYQLNTGFRKGQLKKGDGLGYLSLAKAFPLQAWTGPRDYRKSRLPDFKTISTWRW